MGEQAVSLARAVGYYSAGTCEFLVDPNRNFYFLEMNTRLQVEHPVTEIITGMDLVEEMIKVAAGYPLSRSQREVGINGWALEARVYAEDPYHNFLPSIGKLRRYQEPSGEGVRCDSGVTEGGEISIHYDPMISKLITFGADRGVALERMRKALDEYVIGGLTHNIAFLRAMVDHKKFVAGQMSTKFIAEEFPTGFHGIPLSKTEKNLVASSAVIIYSSVIADQLSTTGKMDGFDAISYLKKKVSELVVLCNNRGEESTFYVQTKSLSTNPDGKLVMEAAVKAEEQFVDVKVTADYRRGKPFFVVEIQEGDKKEKHIVQATGSVDGEPKFTVQLKGGPIEVEVRSPREIELLKHMPVLREVDMSKMVTSPMPGAVVSIACKVGDQVVGGQEVCVIEAMKMQNALRSPRAGKVKAVRVAVGNTVAGGDVLIELE